MATTYEALVCSIVKDPAGALAAALAHEASEQTYLAVPNGEGVFLVIHGLTWWAEAPGGARNQRGHLVAFEGNVRSGQGVPNLWRFDEPDEQLFRLVMLPPVALREVATFYASDDNDDYYRNTIVPDEGGAGWAPRCGRLIPIPVEWASLFLDYPDLGTTFRRIVDLIQSVDEAERVKFQYLAQSVAYACSSASEETRPVSTMASKWKRLILSKQTNDWAQRAWSGQLESAEEINDALHTTTPAGAPSQQLCERLWGIDADGGHGPQGPYRARTSPSSRSPSCASWPPGDI